MTEYVKKFVKAVDLVLNSNTFILETNINFNSVEEGTSDMLAFAKSGKIEKQIISQDDERWSNFKTQYRESRFNRKMVIPDPAIVLTEVMEADAIIYLRSMLTVEKSLGKFWSPYSKQLEKQKADAILESFIWTLTLSQKWKLYTLNTDFCYAAGAKSSKVNILHYFEDTTYANNSATVIVREEILLF